MAFPVDVEFSQSHERYYVVLSSELFVALCYYVSDVLVCITLCITNYLLNVSS